MARTIKLREGFASVSGVGRIDRENCIVHDVKVCGIKSQNGRRYSVKALTEAAPLYENARVFFDHPDGEANTRKFRERFGRLKNVRAGSEGLIADLKYNPNHGDAESFLWLAENDPAEMGLSHNAEGHGIREASGDVLVEKITKVHSVDIVDNPATNLTLFEQSNMDPVTDPGAPADPNAAGSGDLDGKLAALASDFASHPDWDKATKVAKLKALIDLMEDGDEDAEQAAEAEPAEGEEEKEPAEDEMMEQLGRFKSPAVKAARKRLLREQRRKLAKEKGLTDDAVTEVFLEQLCEAPSTRVIKLIEDRRQFAVTASAEKPKSTGQPKPLTPKEIAASIWD